MAKKYLMKCGQIVNAHLKEVLKSQKGNSYIRVIRKWTFQKESGGSKYDAEFEQQ